MAKTGSMTTLGLAAGMALAAVTVSGAEDLAVAGDAGVITIGRLPGRAVASATTYVHGTSWQQVHARDATDRKDRTEDGVRTISGALPVPGNEGRTLTFEQQLSALDNGFRTRITFAATEKLRLNSANWSLFWETSAIAGTPVHIRSGDNDDITIPLPPALDQMSVWHGRINRLAIGGTFPAVIAVNTPVDLLIQDNREFGQQQFEFRFRFTNGTTFPAGESRSAIFDVAFERPVRFVLDEGREVSTPDVSSWIEWRCPWDSAPVDVSFLNDSVAGQHGFLTVNGDRFVFEDGTPVVFWGANLSAGANFPTHEQAAKIAERMARFGVNIVRTHHMDAPWAKPSLIDYGSGTSRTLNADSLDRLHFFHAQLQQHGIYVYLDQLVHRKFLPGDGVDSADQLDNAAKPYSVFDPRLIELQKEYSRALWTTVNPYTGRAPKDDPQYVLMEFTNENDLFTQSVTVEPYRTRLEQRFRVWAAEHGVHLPEGRIDFTRRTDAVMAFFVHVQKQYYSEMARFLRSDVEVRIPMTGSNWSRNAGLLLALADCDFTDSHAYSDHPQDGYTRFTNHRSTASPRNIFSGLGFNRLAGRPFFVSEWDQPWPNEWRAELQLPAAAVLAFQGWNGATVYTYRHSAEPADHVNGAFETALDPARFGLFPHAALLARRDVRPAAQTVTIRLDPARAASSQSPSPGSVKALHVTPEMHRVQMTFAEPGDGTVVAPGDTVVPQDAGDVTSDTGQLYRNWRRTYGTIDTPGTQAAYGALGELGQTVHLSTVSITVETPFAVVALSSLTNDPIVNSGDLLLTTVGRAENTGTAYNLFHTRKIRGGTSPMWLEPIVGTVSLQTTRHLTVRPLDGHGKPGRPLTAAPADGRLTFRIGDPPQTMYYRITAD